MQIGKTIQVEFDYTGLVSAALDKFPNAKIKREGTADIPTRIRIELAWLIAGNHTGLTF